MRATSYYLICLSTVFTVCAIILDNILFKSIRTDNDCFTIWSLPENYPFSKQNHLIICYNINRIFRLSLYSRTICYLSYILKTGLATPVNQKHKKENGWLIWLTVILLLLLLLFFGWKSCRSDIETESGKITSAISSEIDRRVESINENIEFMDLTLPDGQIIHVKKGGLEEERAKTIESIFVGKGLASQIVKTEGFGEKFAEHNENESDIQRAPDRDFALRFVK